MKKNEAIKLCDEKITELKAQIAALKTNDVLSKATRGTQLYARGRERRVLHLISSLCNQIDNIQLSEDDMNTFVLITTLASERTPHFTVEVKAGDKLLEKLQEYKDVKNVYKKLQKAAERANVVLNSKTGVYEEIKQ